MSAKNHLILALPFVRDTPNGRHFWSVETTGDYERDCKIGAIYAGSALEFMRQDGPPGWLLGAIMLQHARGSATIFDAVDPASAGVTVGFCEALGASLLGRR